MVAAIAPKPLTASKPKQSGDRQPVTDQSVAATLLGILRVEDPKITRVFNITIDKGGVFRGNAAVSRAGIDGAQMYLAFRIDPDSSRLGFRGVSPQRSDAWQCETSRVLQLDASKRAGMLLNCKPGNVQCGGKCQDHNMNCFANMSPAQKAAAKQAAGIAQRSAGKAPPTQTTSPPKPQNPQSPKTPKTPKAPKAPKVAPTQTPSAPKTTQNVRTNNGALAKKRGDLVDNFGAATVGKAEANMKRILDDANIYIRCGSSATLEKILGDRFRTSAELGVSTHSIPGLKDDYQTARNRVEKNALGYDLNTAKDARPIYGYFGSDNLGGRSHSDVAAAYGSITIKMKDDVKNRATFTGQDSFKSGVASEAKSNGTPPPPNAASIVSMTRHGYDIDSLPSHYSATNRSKAHYQSQLNNAASAKNIDEFVRGAVVTGNSYVEAQIHGKVTPSDIAEIHFKPQSTGDRPTKAIAQFAKDNGVKLFVDGKEVNPADILNPANRAREISNAIDAGDFHKVLDLAEKVRTDSIGHSLHTGRDSILKQLMKDAGFDGVPQVATAADVTKTWKDGGTLMVRGMTSVNGSRTGAFDMFKTGDNFVGSGMYGSGTYCSRANGNTAPSANKALAVIRGHKYATSSGVTMRMALPKTAKIGDTNELRIETGRIEQAFDKWVSDERARIKASNPPASKADVKSIRAKMDEKTATIEKKDLGLPSTMSTADYMKYNKIAADNHRVLGYSPIVHEYTFADGTKGAVLVNEKTTSAYALLPDGSIKIIQSRFTPSAGKAVVARMLAEHKAGELAAGKRVVSPQQIADFSKSLDPDRGIGTNLGTINNNTSQVVRNPVLTQLPPDAELISYSFVHQVAKYRKGGMFMEGAVVAKVGDTYKQVMPDGSLFDHGRKNIQDLRRAVTDKIAEHRLSESLGSKLSSSDLKAFEAKVNTTREVVFGGTGKNSGGGYSERLAVIRGYDAIKLTHSYEKDNFTLLLNRSAVQVQDTELSYSSTTVETGT